MFTLYPDILAARDELEKVGNSLFHELSPDNLYFTSNVTCTKCGQIFDLAYRNEASLALLGYCQIIYRSISKEVQTITGEKYKVKIN